MFIDREAHKTSLFIMSSMSATGDLKKGGHGSPAQGEI